MYQTEEFGLFIGLTTASYENLEQFTDNEIKRTFARYRKKIMHYCSELSGVEEGLDAYFEFLYRPKIYGVFGSFDLMTVAIIDDFAFATRHFHPFNSHLDNSPGYKNTNYTFHILTGLCPKIENTNTLIDKAGLLYSPDNHKKYPFVGNLSLKLNNALLIGSSGILIDLVISQIQTILGPENENTIAIIYHSLSWNEISILFFSDSLELISSQMLQVRELSFGTLKENTEYYESVRQQSLLQKEIQKQDVEKIDHFENSHIFVHTHSIFGYDSDLLFSSEIAIDLEQKINFMVRWDIKPGHLRAFHQDLAKHGKDIPPGKITSGRADYSISIEGEKAFQLYQSYIQNSRMVDTLKHIRKINTIPGFPEVDLKKIGQYFSVQEQFLLHSYLDGYSFKLEYINKVREMLKRLRLPVTMQDKISRMYVIYNDGIHDPILYGYFIELKQYLETINEILCDYIARYTENEEEIIYGSVDNLVNEIKPWVRIFEEAYKNRFGQSYIMNEITDFNLEFTGGIQQLISAYDGAYKSFTSLLGEDKPRSIVYISGEPHIESDKFSVRLNYFHLFQPEFFAAAATHEAANFFIERTSGSNSHLDKKMGFDRMKTTYEALKLKLKSETCTAFDAASAYFIRDLITLFLTYNRDFELFFYWHWACFFQTGTVYDTLGMINQKPFNDFMARMFLLDKYINIGDSFFKEKLLPSYCEYSMPVQKAWEQAVITLIPEVDRELTNNRAYFQEIEELLSYVILEEIGIVAENLTVFDFQNYIKTLNEKDKDEALFLYLDNPNSQFRSAYKEYNYINYLISFRFKKMEELSKIMVDAFKNSNIYNLGSFKRLNYISNEFAYSFSYNVLFYSYLKYLKENIAKNSWSLVVRNISEGKLIKNGHATPLRIDPFGGLFSADINTRKALLQTRAIFLKTMWEYSMELKLEQFERDS